MSVDDVVHTFRLINIGLSMACLLSMFVRLPEFLSSPLFQRVERFALGVLVVSALYGTLEQMWMDVPGGGRVYILTAALLFLLVSLSISGPKENSNG